LKLQQAGLIDFRRGHITMLDRAALEAHVCECYQVVKMEFDRLLPYTPSGNSLATLTQSKRPRVNRETNELSLIIELGACRTYPF
jgi:hypothetical protein